MSFNRVWPIAVRPAAFEPGPPPGKFGYRRVLWTVLAINGVMFLVESARGRRRFGLSASRCPGFLRRRRKLRDQPHGRRMALRYRATAALAKGATMGLFGLWIVGAVVWHAMHGTLPSAFTMGAVGVAALVANAASFGLLWAYRGGDANMRSAWICTRNDVLGNLAVLLAALACSAPKQAGRISSWRQSWPRSHCKVRL